LDTKLRGPWEFATNLLGDNGCRVMTAQKARLDRRRAVTGEFAAAACRRAVAAVGVCDCGAIFAAKVSRVVLRVERGS
jgi:hypothetical protein